MYSIMISLPLLVGLNQFIYIYGDLTTLVMYLDFGILSDLCPAWDFVFRTLVSPLQAKLANWLDFAMGNWSYFYFGDSIIFTVVSVLRSFNALLKIAQANKLDASFFLPYKPLKVSLYLVLHCTIFVVTLQFKGPFIS